jgi:hypothetical protein
MRIDAIDGREQRAESKQQRAMSVSANEIV